MAEQQQEQVPSTIDDVYSKFNVEGMAAEFAESQKSQQQERQTTTQVTETPTVVPDPVADPEGFKRFVSADMQNRLALRQTLQSVSAQLNQYQQDQARTREEADIRKAVEIVNADLKADPDMVEVALGARARKDPKFLRLYETRHRNPQAWEAALKVVSVELQDKFQMKADPQLVENQRAMKTAQQAMAAGAKEPSLSDKLGTLPMAELDRELDKIKGSYP